MQKLLSLLFTLSLLPSLALAQGKKDWAKPATGFLENLEAGLVDIGALVAGVAILVYGVYLFINGRIDGMRIAVFVLAAVLVTAGPAMIRGLLT